MQTELKSKQKVSRFKGKKFWLKVLGGLFVVSVIYSWGGSSAKVEMEDEKLTLSELNEQIDEREKLIKQVDKELKGIQDEAEKYQEEFDAAMEVVKNKEKISEEIASLQSDIDAKKGEITSLDGTIQTKNAELASLEGKIAATGEQPITLPAGFFTVGSDLPAKRYKAVPTGESGNFFVNGGSKVNIILGSDGFGQPEYVFTASEGDVLESTMSIQFIPVK